MLMKMFNIRDKLISKNADEYIPCIFKSYRTAGKPLKFYKDSVNSSIHNADVWRYWNWADFRPDDRWKMMRPETFAELKGPPKNNILFFIKIWLHLWVNCLSK